MRDGRGRPSDRLGPGPSTTSRPSARHGPRSAGAFVHRVHSQLRRVGYPWTVLTTEDQRNKALPTEAGCRRNSSVVIPVIGVMTMSILLPGLAGQVVLVPGAGRGRGADHAGQHRGDRVRRRREGGEHDQRALVRTADLRERPRWARPCARRAVNWAASTSGSTTRAPPHWTPSTGGPRASSTRSSTRTSRAPCAGQVRRQAGARADGPEDGQHLLGRRRRRARPALALRAG
jgi:hypothetical protein